MERKALQKALPVRGDVCLVERVRRGEEEVADIVQRPSTVRASESRSAVITKSMS